MREAAVNPITVYQEAERGLGPRGKEGKTRIPAGRKLPDKKDLDRFEPEIIVDFLLERMYSTWS